MSQARNQEDRFSCRVLIAALLLAVASAAPAADLGELRARLGRLDASPWNGSAERAFVADLDAAAAHDLGTILDHQGVAVRTGHHCAMPVMQHFDLPGTTRASLALYNNAEDIDRLVAAVEKARQVFS